MSQQKKRLLILTPRFPYPVVGGDRLRIYQVCKALSERFSLTLLSLCETDAEMTMPLPADGVFDRVERVFLSRSRSYLNTLLALGSTTPLQVAYYRSSDFAKAVDRLMPEHDGVLSHLIRCAEYVKESDKPRILEMTDAISLNYERVRQLKNAGGLKAQIYRLESRRLLAYERRIVDAFDLTVLVSETDKVHLVGAQHDKVMVCSNGVALEHLPFRERHDSQPVIVYIGNMASVQNMDACLYFARDVMPLVTQRVRATFRVVGRISDGDAERLRAFPNVEVTGAVDGVAEAVEDARLGVCPVRLGAGVQNKVLEYMALGLPVVTSSIGLEGFEAQPERDLLVADTPKEYAEAISRIWDNDAMKEQLAINGHAYVNTHHCWLSRLAPMVDRIADVVVK
ncbi:Putative glycosyltransferase [gamma proteobacterium HdN1]|nr:Putative glycosyltransferase [gamma proteobacterium HdN1]